MKLILVNLLFVFASTIVHAGPGNDDQSAGSRGGGNVIASAFFDTGMEILKQLKVRSPIQINNQTIDVASLQDIFSETNLVILDHPLVLDGSEVNAINYPKLNRIDLSGKSWNQLNPAQQRRLVIHEILGVAGLKDPQYTTSLELLKIAWVGINWDRGYRPACREERTLTRDQSSRIVLALRSLLTKLPVSFTLDTFTCYSGVDLADLAYSSCGLTLAKRNERDRQLMTELDYAGVAKYVIRDNVTERYDIIGLRCTNTNNLNMVSCKINTHWKNDCISKN